MVELDTVELDTPETPEYLAWVQRLADQAARVRDGLCGT